MQSACVALSEQGRKLSEAACSSVQPEHPVIHRTFSASQRTAPPPPSSCCPNDNGPALPGAGLPGKEGPYPARRMLWGRLVVHLSHPRPGNPQGLDNPTGCVCGK